ncbi:hypothetical protein [Bordetella petrii]|uniref:hypothetical protein n=1 Tax=Bordetella petrii TaxID=94624 RepID=UPI00048CF176|nr:hypothetical protein [Bordetella petrii]
MTYPDSKVMIGCLHGERSHFPRTLEQAFGNGPAITYRRMRRRDRTDWGGNWAPDSHRIPRRAWIGAALVAALLFIVVPAIGRIAGF